MKYIMIFLCVLPAAPAAARMLALKAEAEVAGDVVKLGDLVENAGEFSARPLFRAPPPGGVGSVRVERITHAIQGLAIDGFDPRGLTHVTVRRPVRDATHDEVVASLRTALARVEPTLAETSLRLDPPARPLTLEHLSAPQIHVELTRFQAGSDRFEAHLSSSIGGQPVRVSGRIEGRAQVVVLTRNVPRGEAVRAADLRLETGKNRSSSTVYATDPASVDGLVARRALSAGQPVRPEDFVRPEIVEKNQMVTILYEADGMTLALRGKALSGGREGATIPVQNLQSKRVLDAIVDGAGRVRMPNPK